MNKKQGSSCNIWFSFICTNIHNAQRGAWIVNLKWLQSNSQAAHVTAVFQYSSNSLRCLIRISLNFLLQYSYCTQSNVLCDHFEETTVHLYKSLPTPSIDLIINNTVSLKICSYYLSRICHLEYNSVYIKIPCTFVINTQHYCNTWLGRERFCHSKRFTQWVFFYFYELLTYSVHLLRS